MAPKPAAPDLVAVISALQTQLEEARKERLLAPRRGGECRQARRQTHLRQCQVCGDQYR